MTNKPFSIEDFNRKCAVFIGGIYSADAKAWGFGNARIEKGRNIMVLGKLHYDVVWAERFEKELKFNDDWNWIMMVVERIEIVYPLHPVNILGNSCVIFAERAFKSTAVNKKNATIACINEFLDWYNEKTKDDASDTK